MMKLRIFFTAIICCTALCSFGQKVQLLIGSAASADTDGIYLYEFDTVTGEAVYKSKTLVNRPSYMVFSTGQKYLYAITDAANISSYKYDKITGALVFLNKQSSGGAGPIHISTDDKARFIFASNYDGGSLTVLPLQTNGTIKPVSQTFLQEGKSIDTVRQAKPYVHSAVLSPDNNFLFSSDLGTDRINIYMVSKSETVKPLTLSGQGSISMKPGSGPRFFTFHPILKKAYVIQEMGGMFTAFNYTGKRLEPFQSISMLAENFKGKSGAADLHISPDGRFLYGSNRGDANELVIFSIDQQSGKLSYAGRYPSTLKRPRYFAIDPSGSYLLLTNQGSDNVTVLKRDKNTGLLSPALQTIFIPKPTCLEFVK